MYTSYAETNLSPEESSSPSEDLSPAAKPPPRTASNPLQKRALTPESDDEVHEGTCTCFFDFVMSREAITLILASKCTNGTDRCTCIVPFVHFDRNVRRLYLNVPSQMLVRSPLHVEVLGCSSRPCRKSQRTSRTRPPSKSR